MGMQLPITGTGEVGQGPTLDAAAIPRTLCHGAIHGAPDTRNVGKAMTLIAPHNPLGVLREGPENWRIRFTRTA